MDGSDRAAVDLKPQRFAGDDGSEGMTASWTSLPSVVAFLP
jgi:hypothetical protein